MLSSSDRIDGVTIAQFQSFANKMPAYYFSVAAMMVATAYTFYHVGPFWLAVGIPAFFLILSIVRGVWWLRYRNQQLTDAEAKRHLTRATVILIGSAAVVVWMDVLLFRYGNTHQQYFILFHLLFAAVSGFFCLMHLRVVASIVAVAVVTPFVVLTYSMGELGDRASAINAVVMAAVMLFAMIRYQSDFTHLLLSKAETVRLSTEILKLANTDVLTGLPNRRQFFSSLNNETSGANENKKAQCRMAVGIVDLDGFKPVNDTHGHLVGDAVLVEVARRLVSEALQLDTVCRVGGDEFAFIVRGNPDEMSLAVLGRSVIKAVARPIQVGNLVTSVGCSIGFAIYPDTAGAVALLYERADYALYHAKRSGRARAVTFSFEHQRLIREQGAVEQTLRNADLHSEFYPVFQPLVDVASGRTRAFECLARWDSPTLGAVSPGVFIPIAEQAGVIAELTPVLLRKALVAAHRWPPHLHLSFNVSPFDIASSERTENIINLIAESGIAASRVAIEITETALLLNFAETNAQISKLREFGVHISLDDFGTGYSSLSYVHALRFDEIKIDGSFVADIESNSASRNIVRSVVSLCRDMRVTCVIEGVETEEQLNVVKQLGATVVQGFLFGRPMNGDLIQDYLSDEVGKACKRKQMEGTRTQLSLPIGEHTDASSAGPAVESCGRGAVSTVEKERVRVNRLIESARM